MPTYNYICGSCEATLEEVCSIADMVIRESSPMPCRTCLSGLYHRDYRPQKHINFHEGVYEHIGPNPIAISSSKQLVDECRKHGNESQYMKDQGSLFNVKRGVWV